MILNIASVVIMNRTLKIDDYYGGIDTRTDFSALGINDEELAKRLQVEEFKPGTTQIDEEKGLEWKDDIEFKKDVPLLDTEYEKTKRNDLEKKLQKEREERQNAEKKLQKEHEERQNAEKKYMEERHGHLETQRANKEKAEALAAAQSPLRYPSANERILNWGISLLPSYYDYIRRQELRDSLAELIEKELRANRSEQELKNKIKQLIKSAAPATKKKSKAKAKQKPKKTKQKSVAKTKAKSKAKRKR